MRILHVIDSMAVGGAQTHLLTMIKGMQKASMPFDHRVLCLFGEGDMIREFEEAGIPVDVMDLGTSLSRRRYLFAFRELVRYFQEHQPSLVEAHLTFARVLALAASWRAGTKRRVAFEHGELYLTSPKFRVAHWIAQAFAQKVVVVSEALNGWARSAYRLGAARTLIVHNCVDTDIYCRDRVVPSADLLDLEGEFTIVTVGTLGTGVNKRVDILIQALALLKKETNNVTLLVCGDGELRTSLESLADTLGVSENVKFLGKRRDIPNVLVAASAFVLGTEFDPFPIVGLEALSMGLPIVVPDKGGMVEAVDDGVTGFIYQALDHHDLARKLSILIDAPDLLARMSISARASAEARFSLDSYVQVVGSIYQSLYAKRDTIT